MAVEKTPSGTRGTRTPPRLLSKVLMPLMLRRSGNRFNGMDLLYLTTVGARSGQRRTIPEVSGATHHVQVDQVEGEPRDTAWAQITREAPNYDTYLAKTDRHLPVLRLTPVP